MRAPRRNLGLSAVALTMALVAASSCGAPTLPGPPLAAHVTTDLVVIAAPPPPARVEEIPPRPAGKAVWLDGEWVLRGARWRWRRGRWVESVPGLAFAPWSVVRGDDGQLFMAAGKWVDAAGKTVDPPRTLREAEPSRSLVVGATGEDESVGRDLRDTRDGGTGPLRELRDAGPR